MNSYAATTGVASTRRVAEPMTDNDADKVSRTDCTPWRDEETLRYFYHGKRYSLLETAEAVGCTEGTVSQWCNRLGVETRDAQEARDTGTPPELEDADWLRREYIDNERTCADIADEVDVTDLTVSRWLRRHDIPTRPPHGLGNEDVSIECAACGSTFTVSIGRAERSKYCSRDCYYEDMDMPTGADHWSYNENPNHRPNGKAWHEAREQVRKRDDYECQLCGVSESELPRDLDVHHLERVRDADSDRAATEIPTDLMVSLCRSCHRRAERFAPLLPPGIE